MKNDTRIESNESFKRLIQGLTNFVAAVSKLPENADDLFEYRNYRQLKIEPKIYTELSNPTNVQCLKHYISILKGVSNATIEKSFQDEVYVYDDCGEDVAKNICREELRDTVKELKKDAIDFINDILQTHKKLMPKQKPELYFHYTGDPVYLIEMGKVLAKYGMIDNTSYFSEIMQGKKKDKKINWIKPASHLHYFIDGLFENDYFPDKDNKWVITKNSFTINGKPVPENIKSADDTIAKDAQSKIDTIIENLKKQSFSLHGK